MAKNKITTVSIPHDLWEKAVKYYPYNGFTSFSQLVESLLKEKLEIADKEAGR